MDKRKNPRTNLEPLEIVIEEIDCKEGQFKNVQLFINNVSFEGMRFISNIEFSTDEIIRCHLPSLNIMTMIIGRIAWRKEAGINRFEYGLQILNP